MTLHMIQNYVRRYMMRADKVPISKLEARMGLGYRVRVRAM